MRRKEAGRGAESTRLERETKASAKTAFTHDATDNAGFPPAPPEAHQRAGAEWVQIQPKDLARHHLSGEFFISRAALATLTGEGSTLFDVLDWFNGHPDSITVGDTRQINGQLQAFSATPAASASAAFGIRSIYTYTRAQALADGELVDVTTTAAEAGFTTPVALTRAAWADCVEWTDEDTKRQTVQDQDGRLWDVLWMCMQTARIAKAASTFFFVVYRVPRGGRAMSPKQTRLKACIGPGDAGEPVITIMQPNED